MDSCRQELFTDSLNSQGVVTSASDSRTLVQVLVDFSHGQRHGLQIVAVYGVNACQGPVSAELRAGLGMSSVPLHTTVPHPDYAKLTDEFKLEERIVFGMSGC